MFINNMNAEGIVDQLRHKLMEVEARVHSAAERRQSILTGIAVRQHKRNSRKAQQVISSSSSHRYIYLCNLIPI